MFRIQHRVGANILSTTSYGILTQSTACRVRMCCYQFFLSFIVFPTLLM